MAISQTISIKQAVGVGALARNQMDDVRTVQKQLNGHMVPSRTKLAEDGKSGPKTIGAIKDFQNNVCGFRNCDGRVDPRGKTERALNDMASTAKWSRTSVPGQNMTPGVAVPNGAPHKPADAGKPDPVKNVFVRHAEDTASRLPPQDRQYFDEFRRELIDNQLPWAKGFFATFQTADLVDKIIRAYTYLRKCGQTPKEAIQFLHGMFNVQNKTAAIKSFDALAGQSKFATFAKQLGGKAGAAAILVSMVEIADKSAQGDYHYGAVEAWKIHIGKRVPYLALIDGIWTIIDAIVPANAKSAKVYKLLRAFDPLNLQANGADAMGALVLLGIHGIETGELDYANLERLVSRMKSGAASIFATIGEELSDALEEMGGIALDSVVLKEYVKMCWKIRTAQGWYSILWDWLRT